MLFSVASTRDNNVYNPTRKYTFSTDMHTTMKEEGSREFQRIGLVYQTLKKCLGK